MNSSVVLVGVLFAGLAGGCQSYESGVQLLCESPKHCAECLKLEPAAQIPALFEYSAQHVRNGKLQDQISKLLTLPYEERVPALRKMASDADVAGCELADLWAAIPAPADKTP